MLPANERSNGMAVVSAERAQDGYRLGNGEGEAFWLLGMLEIVKIGGAVTNGEYGLVEVTVWVGDTHLSLPAGSFAFGPKGVPHTFYAETDGARALIGFQPFLFETFLREVGEPATERVLPPPLEGHPDLARLMPIAERAGMVILGPPG